MWEYAKLAGIAAILIGCGILYLKAPKLTHEQQKQRDADDQVTTQINMFESACSATPGMARKPGQCRCFGKEIVERAGVEDARKIYARVTELKWLGPVGRGPNTSEWDIVKSAATTCDVFLPQ